MNWRKNAWELAQQRSRSAEKQENAPFGLHVFDLRTIQTVLPELAYKRLKQCIESGIRIDRNIADQVANAMKNWAIQQGASHWSHWFQPLSGMAAEKQESFFNLKNGKALDRFNGSALIQQEPDASSFPTGGLRSTFEARGITAWDPSSPAFIMETAGAKTLCIPTIFVSYRGQSLGFKAPLLKSIQFLDEHAHPVAAYFDRFATKATCQLGCEQEFYLVDEAFVHNRTDLRIMGRTVMSSQAKTLETRFNYFGTIPERVYAYLLDLEATCHKVGVPVRMRHNEFGPSQFEVVPAHEEGNVAIDHNLLLMDLMQRVAQRHHLKVLLHEKPFEDFNGSGKHCNWSLHSDTGKNLLAPADTPRRNLSFLTFFINTLKAIRDHSDLIRASVASYGNDLRLGRAGAPPVSISVFIGQKLNDVLNDIEQRGEEWILNEDLKAELKLDIHQKIPEILVDNTDLNRISPIAFTGNKFEFRQLGASQHPAGIITIVNTIVGDQLRQFKEKVDKTIKTEKLKKDTAILRELQSLIREVKPILYEGDNYSDVWKKNMEERGLHLAKSTPEALQALISEKSLKLFEGSNVFQANELEARIENQLQRFFSEAIQSARILLEMTRTQVLPAVETHFANRADQLFRLSQMKSQVSRQKKDHDSYGDQIEQLNSALLDLETLLNGLDSLESGNTQETEVSEKLIPLCNSIRNQINRLESISPDEIWPISKIQELLFMP